MKVRRFDGGIAVEYFPSHSHPTDPKDFQRQPLSRAAYEQIDQQLAWGASPKKIKKFLENGAFYREKGEHVSDKKK